MQITEIIQLSETEKLSGRILIPVENEFANPVYGDTFHVPLTVVKFHNFAKPKYSLIKANV